MAPVLPVSGSFAVGSNCETRPVVLNGVSYDQRSPRFRVRFRIGFQSFCTSNECANHRGAHQPCARVNCALATEPSRKLANVLPVFGVNGSSVPPITYRPEGKDSINES